MCSCSLPILSRRNFKYALCSLRQASSPRRLGSRSGNCCSMKSLGTGLSVVMALRRSLSIWDGSTVSAGSIVQELRSGSGAGRG